MAPTTVILGLGKTGLSAAHYLSAKGVPFIMADDGPTEDALRRLRQWYKDPVVLPLYQIPVQPGAIWIVSPGVSLAHPAIAKARARGVKLTNDLMLFAEETDGAVVGVTGTNGKTTVTSMAGYLAQRQLSNIAIGGNIGTPCLDILDPATRLYLLELSSYQLELADGLPLRVAALLNLSPDHLDRYVSTEAYYEAKGRIFQAADACVVAKKLQAFAESHGAKSVTVFSDSKPESPEEFGLQYSKGELCLVRGDEVLLEARALSSQGKSYYLNALAALAIGVCLDLDLAQMVDDVKNFKGLPHRCQRIDRGDQVIWINDSKATNTGATRAAVEGFLAQGPMILLLGGLSKGADFEVLCDYLTGIKGIKAILLYGEARAEIERHLAPASFESFEKFDRMIERALKLVEPGDVVLLSPACASQDQFSDYEARGRHFESLLTRGAA